MDLVPAAVVAYAEGATTPWPPALAQIDAETREQLGHPAMLSGRVVGRLLETLAFVMQPKLVVEIGAFSGASALWMAAGMPPDARLVTCELDPEHAAFARERLSGDPRIELREGPALDIIATLDAPFDLVFIDADKESYPAYLSAVLPKLAPHGLVVADNTLRDGEVLDDGQPSAGTQAILDFNAQAAKDPELSSVLLTVRDGVTLIHRAA